jgi:hypothetical protein
MNKHDIPDEIYPLVQSMLDRLNVFSDEKDQVLKTYRALAPWQDPIMPSTLTNIVAIVKGNTFSQKVSAHLVLLEEKERELIDVVKARTEAIKTESQAVDQALIRANDEFSRKLAKLNDRFERASKATIETQTQLLQMHKQLKVRSRTTVQGTIQRYGLMLLLGIACGLYLPYSPVGEVFSTDINAIKQE